MLKAAHEVAAARQIPYGRQWISEEDIQAVAETLRSEWLTTGPKVREFESAFAAFTGAEHAVAVSSGTAALHAVMDALDLRPGDEVIVPAITFVATANAVVFTGATPVICDVDPETLLIDPAAARRAITARTKAIAAVDYAGQTCDYGALRALANEFGLKLVADSCHALGATWRGVPAGAAADATAFSFHPVKHVTCGEGGMATTNDADLAARMRRFRNHGLSADHREREAAKTHYYEMLSLGFNYRLTDIQCALALSQMQRLPAWLERRERIAEMYAEAFGSSACIRPLGLRADSRHAWHLYVARLNPATGCSRDEAVAELRGLGIGANVHYLPVHLHAFYRERFGTGPGLCPAAERAYADIVSLPMYPAMTDEDVQYAIECVFKVAGKASAARA